MSQPSIEIMGAYRIPVTNSLIEETLQARLGERGTGYTLEERREVIEELSAIALIEVLVRNPDERWCDCFFTQSTGSPGAQSDQAQWNECYISEDGESLLETMEGLIVFRMAFYLHFFNPGVPLEHPFGTFISPALQEVPSRLARLTSYVPVD